MINPPDCRLARAAAPVLLAIALLAAAPAARAQAPDPATRAKAHYELGMTAYGLGHYDRAVQAFLQAYQVDPAPILLYNVAQAYWKKGDEEPAIIYYRRYLQADPSSKNRRRVLARIRELTARQKIEHPAPPPPPAPVATVTVRTPPAPPDPTPPPAAWTDRAGPPPSLSLELAAPPPAPPIPQATSAGWTEREAPPPHVSPPAPAAPVPGAPAAGTVSARVPETIAARTQETGPSPAMGTPAQAPEAPPAPGAVLAPAAAPDVAPAPVAVPVREAAATPATSATFARGPVATPAPPPPAPERAPAAETPAAPVVAQAGAGWADHDAPPARLLGSERAPQEPGELRAAADRSAPVLSVRPPRPGELHATPPPAQAPIYRRPWFWPALGAVSLATVAAIFLIRPDGPGWTCGAACLSTREIP